MKTKWLIKDYYKGYYYPVAVFDLKKDAIAALKSKGFHFQKSSGYYTNKDQSEDFKIIQIPYNRI